MHTPSLCVRGIVVLTTVVGTVLSGIGAPLITEFMASNDTTLADEDGDYSDWIEIHNPDATSVDITGWHLTDTSGDLTRWTFPATSIPSGGFLVVFASGKDRTVPGSELHTSFALSASGEYLALVESNGTTIVSEFSPEYPSQDPDRSYGVAFDGVPLVIEGANADVVIPTSNGLGTTWTAPGFSPTGSWFSGPTGVGFGLSVPGLTVRDVKSTGTINSLGSADALFAAGTNGGETTVISPVVNFLDTGADGHFGSNLTFPNDSPADDNDFAAKATGTIIIPTAGNWTFGINSDDGGRIRINGGDVMVDDTLHGPQDHFGSINLPAGAHTIEAIFFERGGGAEFELFAAPGIHTTFNSGNFQLIGDTANGGLAVFTTPDGSAGGGSIGTNVETQMLGINSGAYVRIPFTVNDVNALDSLSLAMRYNDGFVAYVNGVEVARSNAPAGTPSYNSTATATQSTTDSLIPENFNATSAIGSLTNDSNNVLAIHGLNITAADDSFLVLPELTGGGLSGANTFFFDSPTPGSINSTPSSMGKVADTKFTPNRGFYPNALYPTAPISVSITTATPGATIRYTTDGSAPTETSGTIYSGPISISQTTTLRAMAYLTGYDSTNVDTNTYIFLDDVITQPDTVAPAGWPSIGTFSGQQYDYGMDPAIVSSGNPAIGGVQQVKDALTAIPTMSIVLNQADFSGSNGINSNAGNRGIAWERPASLELIFPEGYVDPDGNDEGFQENGGLRIRGGFSRSGNNPKHALRFFFRQEYGAGKLNYPLFGKEGVDEFDNIDFRTSQNYSWAFQNDSNNNTFLREVFSRDTQRDMGHPYTRSRYYHIYINAQYWGLYMSQERSEASYATSYFGGPKENWDTVKSAGSSGGYTIEVTDGTLTAYNNLFQMGRNLVEPAFAGDRRAEYYKLQGLNPDGTRNPAYPILIDLDNFIDYMILTHWVGNFDAPLSNFLGNDRPNNWFSVYDRTNLDRGFAFFAHDAEHSMFNGWDRTGPFNSTNRDQPQYSNPQFTHEDLLQNLDSFTNAEYKMSYADRVHKAMFNDGVLTPTKATERMMARADIVDQVVIAESARWGDSKGANPPHDRNDWIGAKNFLFNSYIPSRGNTVLSQFIADGLYPTLDAPVYSQHGGYIASTTGLIMSGPGGGSTIYYTLDGSDPRLIGGGLNPSALVYTGTTSSTTLVAQDVSGWRYLDDGSDQGTAWRQQGFSDSSWKTGTTQLGYGGNGETSPPVGFIDTDPVTPGVQKNLTTYYRRTFNVVDASAFASLTVQVARDDGAVVYLNGTEIARSNMPGGTITYQTPAAGVVGGADETTFFSFNASASLLVNGTNTIAAEIHQVSDSSSDTTFNLILEGTQSSNPIFLTTAGENLVRSRTRSGSTWSAMNEATFLVDSEPATTANLVISEIHYRPASPSIAEQNAGYVTRGDFEFIEIMNTGPLSIDLAEVEFVTGITFDFNDSALGRILGPGQKLLLVANQAAFEFRYGTGLPVAGEYSGSLDNDGEQIVLNDATGTAIQDFTYNDAPPWPDSPDGDGYSLTLIDPNNNPNHGVALNWRSSVGIGGTPGSSDATNYVTWKAANGNPPDTADDDKDDLNTAMEYAHGGDPSVADSAGLAPFATYESYTIGMVTEDYLTLHVRKRAAADDCTITAEVSSDLNDWSAQAIYAGASNNGDGTITLRFRSPNPRNPTIREFIRGRSTL